MALLPLALMQIPMPSDGQNPWQWFAVLAIGGGVWVARELLKAKDTMIERAVTECKEWKDIAKAGVSEVGANTTALSKNTDAVIAVGSKIDAIGTQVMTNSERLTRIERGTDVRASRGE